MDERVLKRRCWHWRIQEENGGCRTTYLCGQAWAHPSLVLRFRLTLRIFKITRVCEDCHAGSSYSIVTSSGCKSASPRCQALWPRCAPPTSPNHPSTIRNNWSQGTTHQRNRRPQGTPLPSAATTRPTATRSDTPKACSDSRDEVNPKCPTIAGSDKKHWEDNNYILQAWGRAMQITWTCFSPRLSFYATTIPICSV